MTKPNPWQITYGTPVDKWAEEISAMFIALQNERDEARAELAILRVELEDAERRAAGSFRAYKLSEKYHNEDMLLMQEMEKVIKAARTERLEMVRKQTNIRLDDLTRATIKRIAAEHNMSEGQVITRAVIRLDQELKAEAGRLSGLLDTAPEGENVRDDA